MRSFCRNAQPISLSSICILLNDELDMKEFDELLQTATRAIPGEFFLLPVVNADGRNPAIYRERVYCYELYHQLRIEWDKVPRSYALNGEIDKQGHPYFPEGGLQPDLLVHKPGTHRNFAVIEIKPCTGRKKGIIKDLKTFERFLSFGYKRCIYLVYGSRAEAKARRILELNGGHLPLEMWIHVRPGESAFRL